MKDLRLSSTVQQEYGFPCYPKIECSMEVFLAKMALSRDRITLGHLLLVNAQNEWI